MYLFFRLLVLTACFWRNKDAYIFDTYRCAKSKCNLLTNENSSSARNRYLFPSYRWLGKSKSKHLNLYSSLYVSSLYLKSSDMCSDVCGGWLSKTSFQTAHSKIAMCQFVPNFLRYDSSSYYLTWFTFGKVIIKIKWRTFHWDTA